MTYFQRQIRISRRRALRRILSRRGLILTLRGEAEGSFVASVDDATPPATGPRWHEPDEIWTWPSSASPDMTKGPAQSED